MDNMEKAYWNHEIAKQLGIGESTLRKWCMDLEENGYTFLKGLKDSRAFTEQDLAALIHFKQLIKVKKHKKDQAAKAVVEKFQREGRNALATPVQMEDTRSENVLKDMIQELLEHQKKQEEFNEMLLKKLEEQEQYIKESIEKRDRLLLETIRSDQEKAAAQEKKRLLNRIREMFRF